ncbi:type II toxin-antitoxin system HicB family antitoxin [Ligilactobacillus equi]|uniref:HicB-like antitoxin of toxin-antitoxin system domain-containing protein n=1 Tax=Ligilactobacillus equi DSM 15833 = JCM 10991 TaxID=1423740 RepID=A0A0R1TSR0_9LACO|nr:hypothetical protein [Ligilactobacillus equi]KRL84297.1 hypothetical protein FC36_GL000219 [Ligilactobacillus equi DSM 15833 = JCM 10991]
MTQKKKSKDEIITLPVIIEKTSDEKYPYFVEIPDIDGYTQGSSEAEALLMAKDYIGE